MTEEEIKRGLNDAMDILANNFTGRHSEYEMEQVIEEYKKEMLDWYTKGSAEQENPMKRATQELWYSLYLEKKRLENHRCRVEYEDYSHIPARAIDSTPETICIYQTDGKYLSCKASQMTNIEKSYIRDGVTLRYDQQKRDISYYILRAQNKNGQYICPNCGAEQTLDELLDGCDYCKTKFDISAYDDKVMSVMKMKSQNDNREGNSSETMLWLGMALLGFACALGGFLFALFTLGLSLIFTVLGAGLMFFSMKKMNDANKDIHKNTDWKWKLQDHNPDFSEEQFIGSLDCKLKSIHYATTPEELSAFVKCDIAPFIKGYQNIVNCEIGKISYKDYRVEGDYQYLDIHREIEVLQDMGDRLQPAGGVVGMTLAKKVSHKLKNDISMYRCGGCGATISLVEGGKCKYCGNEMNYATYDWVVVGYRHVDAL